MEHTKNYKAVITADGHLEARRRFGRMLGECRGRTIDLLELACVARAVNEGIRIEDWDGSWTSEFSSVIRSVGHRPVYVEAGPDVVGLGEENERAVLMLVVTSEAPVGAELMSITRHIPGLELCVTNEDLVTGELVGHGQLYAGSAMRKLDLEDKWRIWSAGDYLHDGFL